MYRIWCRFKAGQTRVQRGWWNWKGMMELEGDEGTGRGWWNWTGIMELEGDEGFVRGWKHWKWKEMRELKGDKRAGMGWWIWKGMRELEGMREQWGDERTGIWRAPEKRIFLICGLFLLWVLNNFFHQSPLQNLFIPVAFYIKNIPVAPQKCLQQWCHAYLNVYTITI